MRVGLVGYGYWGINLARTINSIKNLELVCIYDSDTTRVKEAQKLYNFTQTNSLEELLQLDIEAIFIATPPHSHYEIAKKAILAKKHIFVEKPFTLDLEKAYELIELAEKMDITYMVDHVFIYSEPVKYLKQNIDSFGDIVYINSRRINLGLFQYTTDVIWDLAVHDLSIIDYLVGLDVKKVSVFKKKYKDFPNEALASINLELQNNIISNVLVSWLSPLKVRELIIGGSKMSAIYDDTSEQKIKLYDAGIILEKNLQKDELYNQMVQYKYGGVTIPQLPQNQSLDNAIRHFINSIITKQEPLTGKKSIISVIKALEVISKVG